MNNTELNTISKLEQHGYSGIDACLATSLFEYGMAWKEDDKQIEFIYGFTLVYLFLLFRSSLNFVSIMRFSLNKQL